jgi:hypothetical protein
MASLQTHVSRVSLATLVGWTVCAAALVAQTVQPPAFPNAPQGFDAAAGHRHRQRRARRIHLVGDRRDEAGDGLHAARLLVLADVSGALSAARDRRQRDALARTGGGRHHSRQPDRRQEGGADDRRDAPRPLLERAGDIALRRTRRTRRARRSRSGSRARRCGSRSGGGRGRSERSARTGIADGRGGPRRRTRRPAGARADGAAAGWASSSRPTRRSSASCCPI